MDVSQLTSLVTRREPVEEKQQKKKKKKDKKKDKKHKKDKTQSDGPTKLSEWAQEDSDNETDVRDSRSGRRIKRKRTFTADDAKAEARRAALLASLNGGEGDLNAALKKRKDKDRKSEIHALWKACQQDPAKMAALMREGEKAR